jgi:hypothetical protein
MKKIYLIFIVLIGISTSCKKNLEELNVDTKHPTEVPGNFLFANAQKALADQVSSTNVNLNNWKLWAQYWTETTYTDESNYDVVTRDIASNTFLRYYRNNLADLNEAARIIGGEPTSGDAEQKAKENRLVIIEVLKVYTYQRMVDMFGNIPYTEALDINNISPVYDDAETIYRDLISRISSAIITLDDGYGSFGADDIYYSGNVAMWKKFANTLKVKLGITMSTVDNGFAKSTVEAAYTSAFGEGEGCELEYLGGINSNQIYVDMIQSGRHDFVATSTITDMMNTLADPRLYSYFTLVDTSSNPEVTKLAYHGGEPGYSSSYTQFSHIPNTGVDAASAGGDRLDTDVEGSNVADATFPMIMLDYTELCFYLAEAAERGYSVGGSAEEWYTKGITASMNWWLSKHYGPGDVASMTADYLANTDVAYGSAAGDWKEKIGNQAWLAFYYRGFIGYTSFRRLGYPVMKQVPSPYEGSGGTVPRRLTYPIADQTLNADNYTQAANAIGGDLLKTKIFWDVGPVPAK